jgi:hypothetical protein
MQLMPFRLIERLAAFIIVLMLLRTAIICTVCISATKHRTVLTVIIQTFIAVTITAVRVRACDEATNLWRSMTEANRRGGIRGE